MTIGERIQTRRIELGLTQDDLAQLLGYKSRSSINKIENESRNLTQSKIKAISDALQTTPAYIMGWEESTIDKDPPAPAGPSLSSSEYRLLTAFRKLDPPDQEEVARFVDFKAAAPKYAEERKERLA
ncbi:MAG: helix-turn-helix transcriptional regulator [Lachnospiraceae bacterium]|nr:helix-turn-helix transcriptional regulator [Lachnospiraceae bacterium]